jgi:hypothetical protein
VGPGVNVEETVKLPDHPMKVLATVFLCDAKKNQESSCCRGEELLAPKPESAFNPAKIAPGIRVENEQHSVAKKKRKKEKNAGSKKRRISLLVE